MNFIPDVVIRGIHRRHIIDLYQYIISIFSKNKIKIITLLAENTFCYVFKFNYILSRFCQCVVIDFFPCNFINALIFQGHILFNKNEHK